MTMPSGTSRDARTTGTIAAQSADFGFGGTAMALADLDPTPVGYSEIVFASTFSPIDVPVPAPPGTHSGHMRSHVHVLKYQGGALQTISTQPLGDPYSTTHDFHGYAAAGIEVADLTQDGKPEVIVATMHGELIVFEQTNGVLGATPIFRTIVEGSLGAFNSIVVGDFDTVNGSKPEVYIACSMGMRKFYEQ
jgi:hypothetical protein